MPDTAFAPPPIDACHVVELRQYTLHPRQRDVLIDLFDREFVEPQEATGMRVLGQFRDLDRPDHFVWLRGFADMQARHNALARFYSGPVWAAHRQAANATMVDSDNVLLLRPAWAAAASALPQHPRAAPGSSGAAPGVLVAVVWPLREEPTPALEDVCRRPLAALLQRSGMQSVAWYCTETSPNTFAQLPVRVGEPVLVALALCGSAETAQAFIDNTVQDASGVPGLLPWLAGAPQVLRLQPTARSALHA